jgi:hypothetical protein
VPYPEDTQDVSVVWQAWGTGSPQQPPPGDDGESSSADADIPVPGDDPGKGPLDVYFTFSRDYGDTYVENQQLAGGPSAQGEVQLRFSPDGSKAYAAWNDLGTKGGTDQQLDVMFRRLSPDSFPYNTTPGRLQMADRTVSVPEGDTAMVPVDRVVGSRGPVTVEWTTRDGTAVAGTDYQAASGTLEFGHGDLGPMAIEVQTIENSELGVHRGFRVVLTAAGGGAGLGEPVVTWVQVRDDDDRGAPRSKATSPDLQRGWLIEVGYRAVDAETAVRAVALYVRKPGEDGYTRRQVDRGAEIDGAFTVHTKGVDGRYRMFTVATDVRGNVEARPGSPDTVTRRDTKPPVIIRATVTPQRYELGSREGVSFRMRTSQARSGTFLVKANGIVVRRFAATPTELGVVARTWWGRNDVGRLVRPGHHMVVMKAEDLAGNRTRTLMPLRVVDERR